MPNPFLMPGGNISDKDMAKPRAVTPVAESYEGDNNAYRGTEDHGVDTDSLAQAIADTSVDTESKIYLPPGVHNRLREAVKVTQRRRRIKYAAANINVAIGDVIQILPADPKRTRVLLSARSSTLGCRVLPGSGAAFVATNDLIGYTIPSVRATIGVTTGQYLELKTGEAIWVKSHVANDIIEYYYEYEDWDYQGPIPSDGGWR